jgi:Zn-dependent M28 family amino/carboxypeptidase
MLEMAEALMAMPTKPKRSTLLVWHTAEEKGLFGSEWYGASPTVPRDSIVAQLNIDMIGRGHPSDRTGGGDSYLMLIGARRLSTRLGDVIDSANRAQPRPFVFDYTYDVDRHPERVYCRSDHYMYARYGIPIAFFSTGLHGDYHQVTDEAQYIDYPHYALITRFIGDIALRIADARDRPAVDKPYPSDPNASCVQ